MVRLASLVFILVHTFINGQTYTSWRVGNGVDYLAQPLGGSCLMGGATEHDEAMRWFLQRANGGDVLVLRTSGQDGYNSYLYNDLGITVNSVETIRFNQANASYDPYILQRIAEADAFWFAGGDQWDYVSFFRNTPVDSLINSGIQNRNCVIGGTSAGMAILGQYYFSAQTGTITSSMALSNPMLSASSVSVIPFLNVPFLSQTITDTHYDNPDRKGRHIAFMANAFSQEQQIIKGIACDEYTSVCVDVNGWASVFGDFPAYDDNAYFLQMNCSLPDGSPEVYSPNQPLTWNRDQKAIQVYKIKGTQTGQNGFNLSNWTIGTGGEWAFWSVELGGFIEDNTSEPECVSQVNELDLAFQLFPNPTSSKLNFTTEVEVIEIAFFNSMGQQVYPKLIGHNTFDMTALPRGIYSCKIQLVEDVQFVRKVLVY